MGLSVDMARQDEQMVRESVGIGYRQRIDAFDFRQSRHLPLGAAHDGAGEMKVGCRRRAPREDKRLKWAQSRVHGVNFVLQAVDLGLSNPQGMGLFRCGRRAKIRAQIEKVVLNADQHSVAGGVSLQPRKSHGGVGFIYAAVCGDAQRMLFDTRTIAKRCFTLVTPARVDFGKFHHLT